MKTTLTIQESAELIKRGVKRDRMNVNFEPVFKIEDLLKMLPKVLHKNGLAYHYVLTIYWDEDIKVWRAIYDAIGDNIAGDCAAPELIDALFVLVCSLLDNHVKLD